MSNKWKIFWVASFTLVIFFQACGMHSWQELLVSTADEKRMGREFDSLVRIGHKDVVSAGEELFIPKDSAQTELYNFYLARGKDIVGQIKSSDFDAILTSEKLCRNNTNIQSEKVACNKNNFFEFNIINSKQLNAFAVPGGYVYFYTAILKDFKSESELMGVLGHEVGHVVLHHSRDRMVKQVGASAIIEIFLGDGIAGLIGALGANFWLLGHSQNNESEADVMGFEYTYKMGISSEGLGEFFGRNLKSWNATNKTCNEEDEGSFLDVLSTHPPSCKRVMDNRKRIDKAEKNFSNIANKNKSLPSGKYFTELVSAAKI
jgi:hypothetical protein